jgi:hypothetical protein
MKRLIGLATVCLLLLAVPQAQAQKLGIGAFGGVNIPIAQDDAASGTVFGIRGQLQAIPLIRIEPHVSFLKNGDYDATGIGGPFTLDGGKVTAFGINGILGSPLGGPGFGVGLVAGIGSYKLQVEGYEDDTRVGYSGGLDLALGLTGVPLRLNGRGELVVLPLEDGGSRKYALLTVGASYSFGPR